jgi:ABC-type Na+ efflux pump permease subunit
MSGGGRNQQQQQMQNAKNNQVKKDLRDASKATRVVLTSSVRDVVADKDAQTAQLASAAFLCVFLFSVVISLLTLFCLFQCHCVYCQRCSDVVGRAVACVYRSTVHSCTIPKEIYLFVQFAYFSISSFSMVALKSPTIRAL